MPANEDDLGVRGRDTNDDDDDDDDDDVEKADDEGERGGFESKTRVERKLALICRYYVLSIFRHLSHRFPSLSASRFISPTRVMIR